MKMSGTPTRRESPERMRHDTCEPACVTNGAAPLCIAKRAPRPEASHEGHFLYLSFCCPRCYVIACVFGISIRRHICDFALTRCRRPRSLRDTLSEERWAIVRAIARLHWEEDLVARWYVSVLAVVLVAAVCGARNARAQGLTGQLSG